MSAQTRKARAKHITVTKGRLRGRGVYRQIVGHENDPARIRELKARLKRAQTAIVKPKGRLPNPRIGVARLTRLLKDHATGKHDENFEPYCGQCEANARYLNSLDASKRRTRARDKKISAIRRNGFFDSDAIASAKKVKRIHKVQERNTKEGGEIIGVQPGGFIKVKWDNRERPTLIKRSEIKRYPYLRNPQAVKTKLYTVHVFNSITNDYSKHGEYDDLEAAKSRADSEIRNARAGVRGEVRNSNTWKVVYSVTANPGIMDLAGGLQALDYLGEKVGVGGKRKRSNPKDWERFDPKWLAWLHSLTVAELAVELRKHRARELEANAIRAIIAEKDRKRKRNPTVNEMSERFQGRATGKTEDYYFSDSAPRLDMSRAGKLVFLKLKGATIRVPQSVVVIDPKTEKLWLGTKVKTGMFKRKASKGERLDYGDVDAICYLTAKTHIGKGRQYEYVHTFGEDGGRKPKLLIDHEGMPILQGGDYKIEDRGIVN